MVNLGVLEKDSQYRAQKYAAYEVLRYVRLTKGP